MNKLNTSQRVLVFLIAIAIAAGVGIIAYSTRSPQPRTSRAQLDDAYLRCVNDGGVVMDKTSCPTGTDLPPSSTGGGDIGSSGSLVCCTGRNTPPVSPPGCPIDTVQVPADQCPRIPVEPIILPNSSSDGSVVGDILQPGNVCCPTDQGDDPSSTPTQCVDPDASLDVIDVEVTCPACDTT